LTALTEGYAVHAKLQVSTTINNDNIVAHKFFALQQRTQISKQRLSAQQQLSASAPQMMQLHSLAKRHDACTFRLADPESVMLSPSVYICF